ncbi:hypothetical protein CEXT_7601 [Caerostris extrusa]|uniref:RNase H type-1 domain-containing protein n=1 Tax=Caerostris extrusa TaxID=172846 RepID=A0AAV4XQ00_CAEEX|nr:hypothetical protein CEXT_7601 [Caerostris extrusa]
MVIKRLTKHWGNKIYPLENTKENRALLERLAVEDRHIVHQCIPGYSDILGNDQEDMLAKKLSLAVTVDNNPRNRNHSVLKVRRKELLLTDYVIYSWKLFLVESCRKNRKSFSFG